MQKVWPWPWHPSSFSTSCLSGCKSVLVVNCWVATSMSMRFQALQKSRTEPASVPCEELSIRHRVCTMGKLPRIEGKSGIQRCSSKARASTSRAPSPWARRWDHDLFRHMGCSAPQGKCLECHWSSSSVPLTICKNCLTKSPCNHQNVTPRCPPALRMPDKWWGLSEDSTRLGGCEQGWRDGATVF